MTDERPGWPGWFGRQKDTAAGRAYQAAYLGKGRLEQYEQDAETLGSYPENLKNPISMDDLKAADDMLIDSLD